MKLKLAFKTPESGAEFLAKTGETNLDLIHVGLINMALSDPNLATAEVVGDAIEFHVFKDGAWKTEVVADPITRIKAGEVMEPADTPIKMLGSFEPTMVEWHNRIANRYQPFVQDPYFATITPQRDVEVILVDSGVNVQHEELSSANIEDLYVLPAFTSSGDTLGHGTALASLIVGKTLGVNTFATLRVVKISDETKKPTLSELGDALDAIYEHHINSLEVPKIVNMSWSIPSSQYIADKLTKLADAGLMLVAAAGNSDLNIDDVTPAGHARVFTVAASKQDDTELAAVYGTNKAIDMYAPGENVGLANYAVVDDYLVGTGSSYSSAITAGVASILFGLSAESPTADEVKAAIQKDSTFNALILNENVPVLQNRLLHRPDTASLDSTHTQYLGCFPVTFTKELVFDLRVLMPAIIFNSVDKPTFQILPEDDQVDKVLNVVVDEDGKLRVKLQHDVVLEDGVKIKRLALNVAGEVAGASCETTKCYIFISSVDATTDDTKAALEDLNAITEFAFLEDVEDSGPIKVKFPGSDGT